MHKAFHIMMALIAAFISTIPVIACSNPFIDLAHVHITIVTDSHTVNDHSFNESALNGVKKFKNSFDKWAADPNSSAPKNYRSKKVAITYDQPAATDLTTMIQSYGRAIVMNSKVVVASGFIHKDALIAAQNGYLRKQMRYIFIDGDTPNNVVPYENKDLAGLLYKSEQSGFLAGLASFCWLNANSSLFGGKDNLQVATYGGLDIPAVTNYMLGFYWALQLYNHVQEWMPNLAPKIKAWIGLLNPLQKDQELIKIKFDALKSQFTGNFDQASPASKAINSAFLANQDALIFPVAGPQTADTLAAIKAGNAKTKVIGVDTDQQQQYPASAKSFLTSALKNIQDSVADTLWNAIGYDATSNHNSLAKDTEDEIFHKDARYQGGKNFVGIANNNAIKPIYDAITDVEHDKLLSEMLNKISASWAQVLQNGGSYWDYGRTINPFQ